MMDLDVENLENGDVEKHLYAEIERAIHHFPNLKLKIFRIFEFCNKEETLSELEFRHAIEYAILHIPAIRSMVQKEMQSSGTEPMSDNI